MGRLVAMLGLVGLAGCVADGGGYGPGYGAPVYGGGVEYGAPVYRSYEPRRTFIEPDYRRGYPSGGYRHERQESRRPPEREERRPPPAPREERRPGPGIRAPFDRSSSAAPRFSGASERRLGSEPGDREGGR